jgi:threonine synthase
MKYVSTRNNQKEFSFKEVFIKGLADDGGLFIPKTLKHFSNEELNQLKNLNYTDLSVKILHPFCSDFINEDDLKKIVEKSYSKFRTEDVVKITNIGSHKLLELFHGPTLAFKDIAMQFIGNLYEYYLKQNNGFINIVVATSGDTGAAAIDAIKSKKNMNIFVLHPNNKISKVQRKLMTTVKDKNVFNIAINGNFDDCQNLVKSMFADLKFSNSIKMSGVNSINWARIIAQSVYYFFAYFKINGDKKINFSVPTGNFGDVYAGYLSKNMGLPIDKLLVATNQNDILFRAISSGDYSANEVKESISPSMDIQVASNFERLIYDLLSKDSNKTNDVMKNFKKNKNFLIDTDLLNKLKKDFISEKIDENETINEIKSNFEKYNIILDPHTAIGVGAVNKLNLKDEFIILSTAHPCKFPDATNQAINKIENLPNELNYILNEKENFEIIDNSSEKVKTYIKKKLI